MTTLEKVENDWPSIGEDDICHIEIEHSGRTLCGEPLACTADREEQWKNHTICPGCGRPLCPECLQIAKHRHWNLERA